MIWTKEDLHCHFANLVRIFSMRNVDLIDIDKIKKFHYEALNHSYTKHYIELANLVNSGIVSLRLLDLYLLGEYIRTKKFVKVEKLTESKLKRKLSFYSLRAVNKQLKEIQKYIDKHDTTVDKFVNKFDFYEIRTDQSSIPYDMLLNGNINLFVYIQIFNKRLKLDEQKMSNKMKRIHKMIQYLSDITFSDLEIHSFNQNY